MEKNLRPIYSDSIAQSLSSMSTPSLYTLPIELLHRIIDYIDTETIFFSFRNVCKYFYTIINSYNQYKLDFRSITKPTFHRVRHFIQPENVISLIISNEYKTPGQINLFLSVFNINKFTRLRSLTLIQVSDSDMNIYLKHVRTCPLVSLSIDNRRHWKSNATSVTIELFMHSPLRHLALTQWSSIQKIFHILLYFRYLETLMLDGLLMPDIDEDLTTPLEIKSKLKSLTMNFYYSSVNKIISILSCTPSLIHLKLIGQPTTSGLVWDGYWWTEFIQKNLPQLQFFEFFFDKRIDYKESTFDIESIITSFRTSFWLEKRWYVACDYYKDTHELKLYSIPICKPTILYRATPNKISCSNLTNDAPYMMDNVCSLILNLIPTTTVTSDANLLSNHPVFSRVTKLTLLITNDFSNGSIDYLSSLIDLSHLDTLSLTLDLCEQSFKNISTIINALLNRTYNIQSINLCFTRLNNLIEYLDIVFPMISKQVKHLTVDIGSTDEMEWILDRFENFSSITFQAKTQCLPQFDQIFQGFNRKRRDFTFYKGYMCLSFWFGKQKLNK